MSTPNQLYDEAVTLRDKGDRPAAVSKLEQAVTADPNFTIGHGMLARLYLDVDEPDKAVAHARRVVELEPEDAFSYTALSVIYVRCGRIAEAEEAKAMAWNKQHGLDD